MSIFRPVGSADGITPGSREAVRLVKPETLQMDVAGVAGMAGTMPRFQAVHAEDLMKALMFCMHLSDYFFGLLTI